jgi:hypothetical protein
MMLMRWPLRKSFLLPVRQARAPPGETSRDYVSGSIVVACNLLAKANGAGVAGSRRLQTAQAVQGILVRDKEPNFQLTEKINLAKLKHLEARLNDINPELNTDRNRVLDARPSGR